MSFRPAPIACALFALSMPALAQQSNPSTETPEEPALPAIKARAGSIRERGYQAPTAAAGTKTEAALRDVPQTVNVVPPDAIRDQAATSLQDVLKNVPGVGFSHGDGQRDQVSIRGFTAIADQFVDGFRDDALYFRDLSNIERIEVIKGPAAVLYGRGSSGGLINRVSKKPGSDLSEITLSYGSWADKRGEFDVARKDDALSWRVTGAAQDAGSYRSQQFLERQAFAPSVLLKLGAQDTLLLQADYLKDKRLTDFGVPAYQGKPVDVAPGTYYGAANAREVDYSQSEVASTKLDYTHRFSDTLALRNGLRYYHYELDRNNTLPSGPVNETARTVVLNRSNVDRREHGWFNQTELTHKLQLAGLPHELLYGVELGRQDKDQVTRSQSGVATVSLFDPVLPVLPLEMGAIGTNNRAVMSTAAAYVQDMATLAPQWKALLGLRFDRYKQETQERRAGQSSLARTDNAWSPRAGLVWQPSEAQSYYASFSRSFQPSGETFALAANNADIAPEKTVNHELGAKLDFLDGRLSTSAALFNLTRDNIKTTDPAAPTRLVPIGKQRTKGLELTATGDFGDGWKLIAGYAYLDAVIVQSTTVQGKRATLTPRHGANLWVTKTLLGNIDLGLGANHVGDRYADAANTVTLPAYTTVDALAAYRFGSKAQLQLNLRNLFDRRYTVAGHGSNANLNLPGAPRNATLTLRYTL
jgi:catecholate siderophore receptor